MTEKPWLRSYPLDAPKNFTYPEFLPVEDLLIKTALDMPNRTALIFYGKKISYRELNRLSDAFALALMRFGVKKGDRVALLLPNVPQFVIAYYGALKAEAIGTPACRQRQSNSRRAGHFLSENQKCLEQNRLKTRYFNRSSGLSPVAEKDALSDKGPKRRIMDSGGKNAVCL
ncbi:MAG: Long-chain acyl-CoA synthetase [Candidatus Azambacteria bacterium GW2011_GWF2_46_32]|uniref:Long-chain acyl-CoA synthetase n=1 Tax=Candidatus Azambacteria bacterium GW2011_GWF2_46_32 TaxID=1618628 RepID=A0A0G1S360_9BACT|nr:MAG: Long-chain acyl-CoA synthetase [Candidatus Azambacteria bacterium GW2011_GWF2_46_32]